MKRVLIVLFVSLFIWNSPIDNVEASEDYHLCPRDVLAISVWGIDELNITELTIRDDGKIAFPLAGEILVAGLSPGELMQVIMKALDGYINNPKVTVNVIRYHTTRIYVMGEVTRPGLYELEKQHNLLDAIAIAGGYTKDTAKRKVFVLSQGGNTAPIQVNLLQLLEKGDMTQNVSLKNGDVVYLTNNNRIDIARDIFPYITAWAIFNN